ncbi:hypothetical protein Tco_0634402, partial [Tanacetum coccineum]
NYGLQVSQATISNTVKRSLEYLSLAPESVIGINKDDIDEEDDESSTMEPPSRN